LILKREIRLLYLILRYANKAVVHGEPEAAQQSL
jgi:hypothetical protein